MSNDYVLHGGYLLTNRRAFIADFNTSSVDSILKTKRRRLSSNRRLDIKLILTQENHATRKRFFLFAVWQYTFL